MHQNTVEVWGDRVSLPHLALGLGLCAATTAAAAGIATVTGIDLFFAGLGGAIVGFVVSVVVIPPKREIVVVDDDETAGSPEADGVSDPAGGAPGDGPPEPGDPGRRNGGR